MALENNNLNQFADLLAGLIAKYIDKLDIEEIPQVSAMEKSEETKDIDVISSCEVKQEERSENNLYQKSKGLAVKIKCGKILSNL